MSDDAILTAGIFMGLWGLFLAWFHARLETLTLLHSFMALSVALFVLLALGPSVEVGDNQFALVLGVMALPCLVTAYSAYRLSSQDTDSDTG